MLSLEVGKTYIFKDEAAKERYLAKHYYNVGLYEKYYKGGFTLEEADYIRGTGHIGTRLVINRAETKFFKLKDEEVTEEPPLKEEASPESKTDITIYCYLTPLDFVKYSTQETMSSFGWKLLSEQIVSVVVPESSEASTIEHNKTINALLEREEEAHQEKRKELESKLIPE